MDPAAQITRQGQNPHQPREPTSININLNSSEGIIIDLEADAVSDSRIQPMQEREISSSRISVSREEMIARQEESKQEILLALENQQSSNVADEGPG